MRVMLSLILFLCSFLTHAQDNIDVHKPAKGQFFNVTLKANITTGFKWSIESYDKNLFTYIGSHYESPQTKLIGAGGQSSFIFLLKKGKAYPATSKMVFKYARPWDKKSAMRKEIVLHFVE